MDEKIKTLKETQSNNDYNHVKSSAGLMTSWPITGLLKEGALFPLCTTKKYIQHC